MNRNNLLLISLLVLLTLPAFPQLKVTDNNNMTINSNAILDLESDSLGLLPPRIALDDLGSPDPLIPPVTPGMLVYSSGGSISDGFYFWDGSGWVSLSAAGETVTPLVKQASDTLAKTERMILASNDITITLPDITAADNGLAISVKNIGTYTDLVIVKGYSGVTIDGLNDARLTRWRGETYVAYEGDWIIKEKVPRLGRRLDVSPRSSWTTPEEVIAYLNEHMTSPMIVQFCAGSYPISNTIVVDLPYPVTFQGLSFGETTMAAATGLTGKPMFRCLSECYFKMLIFDGSTLANYGENDGEDAIRLVGQDNYHEVKDAYFYHLNKGIVDSANTELWVFDVDFENIFNKGIEITGADDGTLFKISEADFIDCARGIDLSEGSNSVISIINCGFYGGQATDSAIIYRPSSFDFTNVAITGNTWNNIGQFIKGFDFSRTDARDANAEVMNNIGAENKNPHCKINVVDNTQTINCISNTSWYKIPWTNTSTYTCKWTIDNNRITYQPANVRDVYIIISGNIAVLSYTNQIATIAIVKNGNSSSRYGETAIRTTAANQPYQFSTVVYLEDVGPNDYFELWVNVNNSSRTVRVQDINWFVNSQ